MGEWSPSPVWPEGRGLFVLRALLDIRREALRDWLRARGETWIEDPANTDPRFARSRARAALAESSPSVAGTASPREAGPGWAVTSDGRITLARKACSPAQLSAALLCAAGTDRPPRGFQLDALMERLEGMAPVDATLAGARLVAAGDRIEIGRDAGERFRGGLAPLDLIAGVPLVWDGRFEITAEAAGLQVAPLGGVIARLGRGERQALKPIPPWARGAIPALIGPDGAVALPRPLGAGAALANPLAGPRLAATCGLIARESQIGDRPHGAKAPVTLCSGPLTYE